MKCQSKFVRLKMGRVVETIRQSVSGSCFEPCEEKRKGVMPNDVGGGV
jgi:hypothetical protein